jgi:glycosyltransferase involved in cell wall biosynthesis
VAPSHAFREDLLRVFSKHSWKAVTIHNGLPADHLRGETSSFEIPVRGHFALCIAQHNEEKALHVLIEAFARIAA